MLLPAWKPKAKNLIILNNTSIIRTSLTILRIIAKPKIIINLVIVKYMPSSPYLSFLISNSE